MGGRRERCTYHAMEAGPVVLDMRWGESPRCERTGRLRGLVTAVGGVCVWGSSRRRVGD